MPARQPRNISGYWPGKANQTSNPRFFHAIVRGRMRFTQGSSPVPLFFPAGTDPSGRQEGLSGHARRHQSGQHVRLAKSRMYRGPRL